MQDVSKILESHKRVERINNILIELASGNFDVDCEPSEEKDEFDAVMTGISMLREELRSSTYSKEYLQSIYRGIVDMVIVQNPDGTIHESNATVSQLLGHDSKSMEGKEFSFLLEEGQEKVLQEIHDELEEKGVCHNVELNFQPSGGKKPLITSCSASILYDKRNQQTGVLYIAKDITKIKETERLLLEKNRELDTFVYKSSHDLKGPLASIIGLTNVANLEVKDEVSLSYFKLIRKSAERLNSILVDLAELARLRNTASQITATDPSQLMEDILQSYLIDKSLSDIIDFQLELGEVQGFFSNSKILGSVFQNLIDNAIKYRKVGATHEKPRIAIKIKQSIVDQSVVCTVSDNGMGIPESKINQVFDMFLRATEASKGTGLGLYIVKTSVTKLKGTIDVDSIEGVGSTFRVVLPSLKEKVLEVE